MRALCPLALLTLLACRPPAPPDAANTAPASDAATALATPEVDADLMLQSITWLASDARGGRHTLSPEIHEAAAWLDENYELLGIGPVGESRVRAYPLRTGVTAGETQRLVLHGKSERSVDPQHFVPLYEGRAGKVRGELVFVGYATQWDRASQAELLAKLPGEERVELGDTIVDSYDDLAGVDVRGKIALLLDNTPTLPDLRGVYSDALDMVEDFEAEAAPLREAGERQALAKLHQRSRQALAERAKLSIDIRELDAAFWRVDDPSAPLDIEPLYAMLVRVAARQPRFSAWETLLAPKLERLARAGVAGVVLVKGPASFISETSRAADELRELERNNYAYSAVKQLVPFPVAQLSWKQADELLRIEGKRLSQIQAAISRDFVPRSQPLGLELELELELDDISVEVPNVIASIPGLSDEVVLVGAHFDHIGRRGLGSCRQRGNDTICNGADDNASGTAMVLELARAIHATGITPARTLVFAHFSGEEMGLLGSRAFIEDPPFDQSRVAAMVNLDMVSRLGDDGLAVGGLGSSEQWLPLLESIDDRGMQLLLEASTTTRSDHAHWFLRQIPVLFLFTGLHEDYHRASDEVTKIDAGELGRVGQFAADVVWALAQGAQIEWGALAPGEGIGVGLPGEDPNTVLRFEGEARE